MTDISKKDSLILYYLNKNCRMPASQIGKKIHLSKQSTIEKIKKIKKEYINFYNIWPNYSKLGFTSYKLFFKIKNLTLEEKEIFIQKLSQINQLVWVASTDGIYDFISAICVKNNQELSIIIKQIKNNLNTKNFEIEIIPQIKAWIYGRDYLNPNHKINDRKFITLSGDRKEEKIFLTETEQKILLELSKNPRIKITDLAQKINEKTEKTNYYFKQLIKKEIIKKFSFIPKEEVYPFTTYKLYIEFTNLTQKEEKNLLDLAQKELKLIHILFCTGKWDCEINLEVLNQREFNQILTNIKKEFGKSIKEYGFVMVEKTYKMQI